MYASLFSIPDYYLLAAFLGLMGQAVRGILGLVKVLRVSGGITFSWGYFSSTLMLGGLSGLLGGLIYDLGALTPSAIAYEALWNDRNFILMAISAGYVGADAIEGILGKHVPARSNSNRSKAR